jgi:hypothetical protein
VNTAVEPCALGIDSDARQRRVVGIALLIAASVMWSLSGVAVKVVRVDSIAFAFWRSAGAALAMLPLAPFASGKLPRPRMLLLSVALYTAVVTLLITAMTGSSAGTGILLQYTGPIFCAMFAWMFFRRRISGRTMLALVRRARRRDRRALRRGVRRAHPGTAAHRKRRQRQHVRRHLAQQRWLHPATAA